MLHQSKHSMLVKVLCFMGNDQKGIFLQRQNKVLVRYRTECCNYLNPLSCHSLMETASTLPKRSILIAKKACFQQAPTMNGSDLISLKDSLKETALKKPVNYFKCYDYSSVTTTIQFWTSPWPYLVKWGLRILEKCSMLVRTGMIDFTGGSLELEWMGLSQVDIHLKKVE